MSREEFLSECYAVSRAQMKRSRELDYRRMPMEVRQLFDQGVEKECLGWLEHGQRPLSADLFERYGLYRTRVPTVERKSRVVTPGAGCVAGQHSNAAYNTRSQVSGAGYRNLLDIQVGTSIGLLVHGA